MLSIIAQVLLLTPPILQCHHPIQDVGVVKSGPALQREFLLSNPGNEVIHLLSATSGCGCAKPILEKTILLPGESSRLVMTVNTLTQPAGKQTWKSTVSYKIGDNPAQHLELRLVAELVREVSVTPPELAISTESTARQILTLTDLRPRPLTVTTATSSNIALKVKIHEPQRQLPRLQLLELTVEESLDVGDHHETILLNTDDKTMPMLTVPVRIHKRPKSLIRQSPEEIEVKLDQANSMMSRLIQLRHKDSELLEIDRIECSDKSLSLKWSEGRGPVQTVRIQVVGQPAGETTTITVHFKSPQLTWHVMTVRWRP